MSDNELDVFESDLRAVLKFLKHSNSKEELSNLLKDNAEFENMERLTAQTISICSNVDFNIPVGEERINLCKAIEDMKEDARNEGRKEGRNEERNNGMLKSLSIIKNLSSSKDIAIHELSEAYSLSAEEAMAFVNNHW